MLQLIGRLWPTGILFWWGVHRRLFQLVFNFSWTVWLSDWSRSDKTTRYSNYSCRTLKPAPLLFRFHHKRTQKAALCLEGFIMHGVSHFKVWQRYEAWAANCLCTQITCWQDVPSRQIPREETLRGATKRKRDVEEPSCSWQSDVTTHFAWKRLSLGGEKRTTPVFRRQE